MVETIESTLTCPECGYQKTEEMPTDSCVFFWECEGCKTMLKPVEGDCCVFCSYGTAKCYTAKDRQEPSYTLTFEYRPEFLLARVHADSIDEQGIIAYLTEVAEKCIETGSDKVLVVRDIFATLGIANQYHTTTGFIEQMRHKKAAFVNPYPFVDDELDFAITVASNRGGNFQLFRDIESAEKWLLRS